uniref:MFS domain-containing protein n=1 Tax=Heterorhabditis bacteriophora TaxID=37862 RepID=A0A1I7XN27_HETBA
MGTQVARNTKKTIGLLVSTLVIDMLAFTSILPLFPSILNFYSKDGHRDSLYNGCVSLLKQFQSLVGVPHNERYNNVFFGGLLGSIFSALQFVSSPSMGSLSDVYGRRTMLLISCLGTLTSYIIWLRAETFTIFVVSRILGGLSKANINVATAIISDIYSPQNYPKGMTLIGIAYSIGFLIGPMIGAYFSTVAPHNALHSIPAIFCIILTIIQFAIILFILPETLKCDERQGKIYLFTGFMMLPIQGLFVRKTPMHKYMFNNSRVYYANMSRPPKP